MSLANKIDHTRYVLINRLATPLGSFILLMIIARQSDVLLGEYAIIMAFYFVMQMLPLLGLTTFVMREVSRKPEEAGNFFISIGFLSVLGCVIVDLGTFFSLSFFDYPHSLQTGIYILGLVIVPGILIFLCELIFMSLYRAKTVGLIAIIDNISRLLLSVITLYNGGGLAELMWIFLLSRTSACIAYIVIMQRTGILNGFELPDLKLLRRTIHLLPAFLAGTLLLAFLGRLDFFMLSLNEQIETIGYYAIGYRVFDISLVVLSGLIMALFPFLSRKFVGSGLHYRVALRVTLQGFAVGLGLFCFIAILYAQYYVFILFTNQYPAPVLATQLFMAILLIAGIDHLTSSLLHASDMQVQDTQALSLGGLVFTAMLIWLVPVFGLYGAIVSRGFQALFQLSYRVHSLQKVVGKLFNWQDLLKLAAFTGLLGLIAFTLLGTHLLLKTVITLSLTCVVAPLLLTTLGIFQPLRILRFFWKPHKDSSRNGVAGLADLIVRDQKQLSKYLHACNPPLGNQRIDRGQLAVLLFRLACYLNSRGISRMAKLLAWTSGYFLQTTIVLQSQLGPGLVLDSPRNVYISAISGKNMVCRGTVIIGSKLGDPAMLGDSVVLESGSIVGSGDRIPSNSRLE